MACGQFGSGSGQPGDRQKADPFSFAPEPMMTAGFGALAMMWAAPWRAACILASEAVRESLGDRR
jgi:hypothetical protein